MLTRPTRPGGSALAAPTSTKSETPAARADHLNLDIITSSQHSVRKSDV
jgi:hypothetical protein